MNFNQNLKVLFKKFPLRKMNGQEKFLLVAANQCGGKLDVEMSVVDIQKKWRKPLSVEYHPSFYDRAQEGGKEGAWVDPISGKRGKFVVTKEGVKHLLALLEPEDDINIGEFRKSGKLVIVNRKGTHTFDRFLRKILVDSKKCVMIADSWVSGDIFDTVLDAIPKDTIVKVLYSKPDSGFVPRAKRFSREYSKFDFRRYKFLHDRFIIADDVGYILGPSIKDAASKSPALIVILDKKETNLLKTFFQELWRNAR